MWCRSMTLKTRAVFNNPSISTYVQCLTSSSLNFVTLKHSMRSFSSNACDHTIGEVIDQWSRRFENEGITEPVESIEHIVAHVIGTKKVISLFFFRYN